MELASLPIALVAGPVDNCELALTFFLVEAPLTLIPISKRVNFCPEAVLYNLASVHCASLVLERGHRNFFLRQHSHRVESYARLDRARTLSSSLREH